MDFMLVAKRNFMLTMYAFVNKSKIMFKKIFVLIFLSAKCMIIWAQAPFIDTTWLPNAGEKYYTFNLIKTYPLNGNDSGSDITWNFDSLYWLNPKHIDSFDFVVPTRRNIPCINSFANLASGDSLNFTCFLKNANGLYFSDWKLLPIGSSAGKSVTYWTKPDLFFKADFGFRDIINDTSKYYYYFEKNHLSTDSIEHGYRTSTMKYDGYGKLKIAGKFFDTAARILEMGFQIDSMYSGGIYNKNYYLFKSYKWFTPSIHVPVLRIDTFWIVNKNRSVYDTLYFQYDQEINLIAGAPGTPIIEYPHDFHNANAAFIQDKIILNGITGNKFSYAIYDTEGRMLYQGIPLKNDSQSSFYIPGLKLSQGMYIIHLDNNKGQTKSIKIVKDY
jgi:hypothetical protein